jgi:hypothetical protein
VRRSNTAGSCGSDDNKRALERRQSRRFYRTTETNNNNVMEKGEVSMHGIRAVQHGSYARVQTRK